MVLKFQRLPRPTSRRQVGLVHTSAVSTRAANLQSLMWMVLSMVLLCAPSTQVLLGARNVEALAVDFRHGHSRWCHGLDPASLRRSQVQLQAAEGDNGNFENDGGGAPTLPSSGVDADQSNAVSATKIFLDISIRDEPVGRLVFDITNPSNLPIHTENFIQLISGSRRSIDSKTHYEGCAFDFLPTSIESNPQYRWGHSCKGRGRNALYEFMKKPITDPANQLMSTHSCFGGQYYGDFVDLSGNGAGGDPSVVLTVPVVGPGFGSSKFSIVRVGESPKEWRESLLINSGVIGILDPSCLDVLQLMARQTVGPPTIKKAGVLDE